MQASRDRGREVLRSASVGPTMVNLPPTLDWATTGYNTAYVAGLDVKTATAPVGAMTYTLAELGVG